MSIVIITSDKYQELRDKTKEQEHHIEREAGFAKWRMYKVEKYKLLSNGIGLALSPVVAIWTVLIICASISVSVVLFFLKVLAKLFHKKDT